jgi:hypothetical protein
MRIEIDDRKVQWERVVDFGVGRAIVEELMHRLDGYSMVTLTAAPAVQGFYRRLGWQSQTTATLLSRSEEQRRANCVEGTDSK